MSVDSKEESEFPIDEVDEISLNRKILFNVEDHESIYSSNIVGERGGTIESIEKCKNCKGIVKANTLTDLKNR